MVLWTAITPPPLDKINLQSNETMWVISFRVFDHCNCYYYQTCPWRNYESFERKNIENWLTSWTCQMRTQNCRMLYSLFWKADPVLDLKCIHYDGNFWQKLLWISLRVFLSSFAKHNPIRNHSWDNKNLHIFGQNDHMFYLLCMRIHRINNNPILQVEYLQSSIPHNLLRPDQFPSGKRLPEPVRHGSLNNPVELQPVAGSTQGQ